MKNKPYSGNDEIISYIEKYGIERKDIEQWKNKSRNTSSRSRSKPHRMTLDLHGMNSEEAERRLRYAFDRCKDKGIRELLVIHGYGLHSDPNEGPVLKKMVRCLLENDLRNKYRTYRPASPLDGGDGATLIIFK